MNITTHKVKLIWALSMAGNTAAQAEMKILHNDYPQLNEKFSRFKLAIDRIRAGVTKKPSRRGSKS